MPKGPVLGPHMNARVSAWRAHHPPMVGGGLTRKDALPHAARCVLSWHDFARRTHQKYTLWHASTSLRNQRSNLCLGSRCLFAHSVKLLGDVPIQHSPPANRLRCPQPIHCEVSPSPMYANPTGRLERNRGSGTPNATAVPMGRKQKSAHADSEDPEFKQSERVR